MPIGTFHIDELFGLQALSESMELIALHRSGISYAELGVTERKALAMPTLRSAFNPFTGKQANIAHLKLSGVMRTHDGLCTRGIESLVQDFRGAYADTSVTGIVLECNTGGGEKIAGEVLKACIQSRNKPVIAYPHSLKSAGILATLACDEIIASSELAEFGSIGTMLSLPVGFAEMYNQYQVDMYAKDSTEKNDGFRDFLKGSLAKLQTSLDKTNVDFMSAVSKYRPLTGNAETDRKTLSGAVFNAIEAKNRGLIDQIGTFQLAMTRVMSHAQRFK